MADGSSLTVAPRGAPDATMVAFLAAFESAGQRAGTFEDRLVIAGQRLLLRFAGEAMHSRQSEAFRARPRWGSGAPDLTVVSWDSDSTGVPLPRPCEAILVPEAEMVPTAAQGAPFYSSYMRGNSGLSLLAPAAKTAGYWVQAAANMPFYDRASPLRVVLNWWLALNGSQMVHGAAVGHPDGMVLLGARGGSGKTTTSLACLAAGMAFAGDDYCALSPGSPPTIRALYSTAKLSPRSLELLPALLPLVMNALPEEDKHVLALAERFPALLVESAPLRAVAVPQLVEGETTTFARISPLAALAAIAPSTLLQLPPADGGGLARMRAAVESLPCYTLRIGSDVAGIPGAVARLLEIAGTGGAK